MPALSLATVSHLRDVARAYDDLAHAPERPEVLRAYLALAFDLQAQWNTLVCAIDVEFTDADPYRTSQELFDDVRARGAMRVYTGSDLPVNHPMACIYVAGRPLNLIFRAIHDAIHCDTRASFGPAGELRAFQEHAARLTTWDSVRALATETLGQNAWVNFGPRSAERPRIYAEQKATLLPDALIVRAIDCARGKF